MPISIHQAARYAHIGMGTLGLVLGLIAILVPKFGPWRTTHRWVGRVYALAMMVMATLSIPLAYRLGSPILFVIGCLTLLAVVFGWHAARQARYRRHVILMSSSYIAGWTAFLLTNPIIRTGTAWDATLHRYGPTVIGTVLIVWYLRFRLSPTIK